MEGKGISGSGILLGQPFRSKQVYQCVICHTKTNKWVTSKYIGTCILWPCIAYREHEILQDAILDYSNLQEQIKEYEDYLQSIKDMGKAEAFISNLRVQGEFLAIKISKLRQRFEGNKLDDILGIDFEPTIRVKNPSVKVTMNAKKSLE